MSDAEAGIDAELEKLRTEPVKENELIKVKNKVESTLTFGEMDITSKALNLAIHELLNDATDVNKEVEKYLAVDAQQMMEHARRVLDPKNCSSLYYSA